MCVRAKSLQSLWRGELLNQHLKIPTAQFSCSVVSDSLQPCGLQHARPPCPSPTPGAYPNSCPLSQWCHPTISTSVVCFSSCLQSFPASGSLDPVYSVDRQLEWGVSAWSNVGLFTRYACTDFVMRVWTVLTENTEWHTGFQHWGWKGRMIGGISLLPDQHRDCWHAHVFCACSPHWFVRCSIECKVETHFLIFYNFQIACLFLLILFTSRNVTFTYRTDFCPATDSSPSNINIDKPWKWINKKHALTWTTITRSRG